VSDTRIYLNVLLTVRDPAHIGTVEARLRVMAARSSAEAGCERFEIYHSQSDDRVFLLVETWSDAGALEAHRAGAAFTGFYVPEVLPYVERQPHPSDRIA
jgi:quinol monooxygenase YgiN